MGHIPFLITKWTKEEESVFSSRKIFVLTQVDAKKETHVALATRLGIMPRMLKTVDKKRKDAKKCYAQCGRFSGQRNSLKQSPFQAVESLLAVWFKQARTSNAVISGSLLRV